MNTGSLDLFVWRRGRDSNAQCLAAHHISNVAPYQLEYLSNWHIDGDFPPFGFTIITKPARKIKPLRYKIWLAAKK